MSGHQIGGFHGSSTHGLNHQFGPRPGFHRFAGHNQFFHNNRRFFFGFDVVAFGFPYWWYPDYYYGYSNSYADYEASPLYDYRYWAGMATAVQTELANRGYFHGSIDGAIGPGSREAIRAFQKANNLPVSGLIDPPLLQQSHRMLDARILERVEHRPCGGSAQRQGLGGALRNSLCPAGSRSPLQASRADIALRALPRAPLSAKPVAPAVPG
jgi:Putative peptidoglycan binding domain